MLIFHQIDREKREASGTMQTKFNLRDHPQLEAALTQASEEHQLAEWYRACVRPLLNMPRTQWPRSCGRGCEPCAETLVAVAERIEALPANAHNAGPT